MENTEVQNKFLKTIANQNKKLLAQALFDETPIEELIAEYGTIRVQEMQTAIANFESVYGTQKRTRAIPNAGCRACMRSTCEL